MTQNSEDHSINLAQAALQFQQGQRYFEAGRYREATKSLNQACALAEVKSKFHGEILLWLVIAQDAAGQRDEALTLCRQLTQSPYLDIRRQSRRILNILEAPKLSIHEDWVTKIPSLDSVNQLGQIQGASHSKPVTKSPPNKTVIQDQEIDLSQVNTSDQGLAVLATLFVIVMTLGLVWLA